MPLLNTKAFFCCIMLDNELLKEKECSLMINSLSELSLSYPSVRSVRLFTIIALQIINYEFYHEILLQKSTIQYFLLDSQLNL
jgi:hypothetical protein